MSHHIWNPSMEEAPKDGTAILAADDQGVLMVTWEPSFTGGGGWAVYSDGERAYPTHWMPLPGLPGRAA